MLYCRKAWHLQSGSVSYIFKISSSQTFLKFAYYFSFRIYENTLPNP